MLPWHRRVAVVAYDGMATFELGIVIEVFGRARPELDQPWYQLDLCRVEPGPLRALGGFTLGVRHGLGRLAAAGTIVVPGWRDLEVAPPAPLLQALKRAHQRGARLMSICSGVFVLAAAGLLDGKRATTHWRYAERLAARHPAITVDANVLYVDEGSLLTSAGSAAGIDLCLHVVRRDYGAAVANVVARRLVMPPHREGGQAQYLPEPVRVEGAPPALGGCLDWALAHLGRPIGVADLARRARMSPRTFARRFGELVGATPAQWLILQRVAAARRLLESSARPIDGVAAAVGLGSETNLRHHFRRVVGTSPAAYRRQFAAPAARPRQR